MRYYNQGAGFRIAYNASDASKFAYHWPCSTVDGSGWFEFDAVGNLVNRGADTKRHADADGDDWVAFSQDCQVYGKKKHGKTTIP